MKPNDRGLPEHQHDAPYRLHFDPDAPAAAPTVSELPAGTAWPPSSGFLVVTDARRLTVAEWVRVKILRKPDPRTLVYPVEVGTPGTPGPDTQTFTVSL